ncbi:hypothetical protein [Niallia endozanthoxylica]|uniref:Uncharacterized protein n=1 Tax=Niallia endozanthoxylica TaxID=2036016 RepID=A0A5J5I205_9BACI|nr:hypothetical protein [Niallia endozanthoxylica]KAA9027769.1 hypothetical protein F4V44_05400 [Niallia endozanthoxylica]
MDSNSFYKRKKLVKQSAPEEQEDFSLRLFSNLDKNFYNIKAMLDNPSDLITEFPERESPLLQLWEQSMQMS